MKLLSLPMLLFCACLAQPPNPHPGLGSPVPFPGPEVRLPRSQRNAIVKTDYKKNLEDAAALLKLAQELKADLDKENAFVVSIKVMKRAEDIEKLAKTIHGRLKGY